MIKDRPQLLLDQPGYKGLPPQAFHVDMAIVPERVRASIDALGGIQPVTGAMMSAAGGTIRDKPSPGEVELHRKLGTRFQNVFVVMNVASLREAGDELLGAPYAISLIPSSKRGVVQTQPIDFIEKIDRETIMGGHPCYLGYDPFNGDWRLFGGLGVFNSVGGVRGFVDEVGLVIDQYFLATSFDEADVLELAGGFSSPEAEAKYNKHRNKRFFRPFERVESRRIWGAESPIELFLLQRLLFHGLSPSLQMILCDDGTTYGALYHLWRDRKLGELPNQITEADMYFPDQRVAVFCDSLKYHSRAPQIAKDKAIDERLHAAGFKTLRLTGDIILNDLEVSARRVIDAL